MQYKPSSDTKLKDLRIVRSLSQDDVAEAIGSNANTVSRWERGVATPSPYYRRKLADFFGVDPQEFLPDPPSTNLPSPSDLDTEAPPPEQEIGVKPSTSVSDEKQTMFLIPLASGKTTEIIPPEIVGDPLIPEQGESIPSKYLSRSPFTYKFGSRIYITLISIIMIIILIPLSVFALPSLLPKSSPDLFPALCSGNFQSTNTSIVSTPATSTSPDGETIGLSEGEHIFDLQRPNQQEVQYKLQAAQAATNDPQNVVSSLRNALSIDQTDAEAQIYLENWRVLNSNHPHITFLVGVTFTPSFAGASRGTLQGAFTAQKECNNLSRQDSSKTQIVLIIANIGGSNPENRASSARIVADQIADQANKDSTIVGIMGWLLSADSINVNHQLKVKGSHLPMISPISASDELEGMSNFFRVCPTNREQIQIAANFLLNVKHKSKIAIIYDNTNSYSNNLKDDLYKDIKDHIIESASFTGGNSKTLQDALTNVLAKDPDAIFFAGYVVDLAELLHDISSTPSANLLIMGGNALGVTNDYQTPLPDMHNVYFTAYASPNQWNSIEPKPPFFQDYMVNFQTDHASNGLPSVDEVTMLGYDALLALLHGSQQVLSTKNSINASDLTQALKQITVKNAIQGVTGRIAFDSKGDQDLSKTIFVEHIEGTHLVIDKKDGCLQKDQCSS